MLRDADRVFTACHTPSFSAIGRSARARRTWARPVTLLALALAAIASAAHARAATPLDTLIAAGDAYLADAAARSRGAAIRAHAATGAMAFLPAPVSAPRLAGNMSLASGRREGAIAFGEIAGNADLGVLGGPGDRQRRRGRCARARGLADGVDA